MLLTDTDSVTYEIKSEGFHDKFFKHKHLFDFSNFLKGSKFHDNQNEMVTGKMKVVNKGIPINKFVGLKPKMDSMLSDESNTAKGVNITTEFN